MKSDTLMIWNRKTQQKEQEKIYGESWIRFFYENKIGQSLLHRCLIHPWLSRCYGWYQSTRWSARKIPAFVKQFHIPLEEFRGAPYRSFNDFFIREFQPQARHFIVEDHQMPAFAEGRYLAFESMTLEQTFPVKGQYLTAESLIGSSLAKPFVGGPILIARLCPTDYHRFHFPDQGVFKDQRLIAGALHSVNPKALQFKNNIFCTNQRQVSVLQTRNFGQLAMIEVGALCVGKIVQVHSRSQSFERGMLKGYFLFGGSTVILLGQPGIWIPAKDLLQKTAQGLETQVELGSYVAHRQ